jgi:hypothetical protein
VIVSGCIPLPAGYRIRSLQADDMDAHCHQDGDAQSHDEQEEFSHGWALPRTITPQLRNGSDVGESTVSAQKGPPSRRAFSIPVGAKAQMATP